MDASFVEAPKQRNTKEENDQIKEDETPENWSENKRSQKDVDTRWVTKGGQRHYGYKNHIKIDRKSKFIKKYTLTSAAVHDSQAIESLISNKDSNHEMFADSAYSGNKIKELLKNKISEIVFMKRDTVIILYQNTNWYGIGKNRKHVVVCNMCSGASRIH